jgi:hypothetical protein
MGYMKLILPVVIIAALLLGVVPLTFIYFANDVEQNVSIEGANSGAWQILMDGLQLVGLFMADGSWVIAILLIVTVIVIVAFGIVAAVKHFG